MTSVLEQLSNERAHNKIMDGSAMKMQWYTVLFHINGLIGEK